MTKNQLAYWELQETKRSNRAKEEETTRSNLAKESETERSNIARETETHRSALVNEGIERDKLSETQRHNVVTEAETNRDNVARNLISTQQLVEAERHNKAVEDETHRYNYHKNVTDYINSTGKSVLGSGGLVSSLAGKAGGSAALAGLILPLDKKPIERPKSGFPQIKPRRTMNKAINYIK